MTRFQEAAFAFTVFTREASLFPKTIKYFYRALLCRGWSLLGGEQQNRDVLQQPDGHERGVERPGVEAPVGMYKL
jgi:hypothetical protein